MDDSEQLGRLLAAVALGDRNAFRKLYDTAAFRLYGFALRILPRDELAQEALQDAFVAIWHAAATYQPHLSAPLTWMATVVRNKALDIRRRMDVRPEIDLGGDDFGPMGEPADPAHGPYERVALSREASALATCMGTLASRQRQAIGLAYLHDLSHSEVAAALSLPIGTVKTWIRRGLDRLRDCLGKRGMA